MSGPPYPPEKWIPEIPFDVAIWGDKPSPYEREGLFPDEESYRQAVEDSKKLPKSSPMPGWGFDSDGESLYRDDDPETTEKEEL